MIMIAYDNYLDILLIFIAIRIHLTLQQSSLPHPLLYIKQNSRKPPYLSIHPPSQMTTQNNNSRYYYVSNENMSEYISLDIHSIKESIDEYSMNFEKQSAVHSRSEIAEMISGSHQPTQSKFVQNKSRNNIKPTVTIRQEVGNEYELNAKSNQVVGDYDAGTDKKPVNLGEKVLKVIHERYHEVMKITTEDPEVLYDFYLSQRKNLSSIKQIKDSDIEKQMPSMQRKLIIKQQFQKILTYYPDDVYYTLVCQTEILRKDRQRQQKIEFLNRGAQSSKNKRVSENEMKQIVEKLYNTKGNLTTKQIALSKEEIEKIDRTKFGKNLSQHFQNTYRSKPPPSSTETVQKLHQFWQNLYQREQYGIEWPQQTAKQTIEQYMYQQIEDLMTYAHRKLGFKCGKAVSLLKLYEQNFQKIDNVQIPMNSFQEYVKVYNTVEHRKVQEEMSKTKQHEKNIEENKKKKEVKKFGRPVSATPITVLSKPKTHSSQLENLAQKYPKDKLIRTLMTEEHLRKPRHPLEYGVYDIEQQVKLKQWVKIDPKKKTTKYQDIITDKIIKTFTNTEFANVHHTDQVMSLLAQQNLQKKQVWKQLGPILQQAMLVKAHQNQWFRDCMIRYLERVTGHNYKLDTNQVIFKQLFAHLNKLEENQKSNQFQKLESLITTSQNIADKGKMIQELTKDQNGKQKEEKEKRLLYALLQDKAVQYIKMRIRKTNQKFTLRNYLKQLYQDVMKEHKDLAKKIFNIVDGDKQCPKLLKYQFFRLVKQINPLTLQKQKVLKNHVWVPPKQTPESFNYKTFNTFSQFYMKDRNIIVAEPEAQKHKNSLWGRKKAQDRENLMMTYQDAQECTFQPRYSKKL